MQTTRFIPELTASIIASAANPAGTNITETFAFVAATASFAVLKIGTESLNSVPPLPGVTPATTFVQYSIICVV